jgi:hypothetical protein
MRSKAFTGLIVLGALFAPVTTANASDGKTHYEIFNNVCVATHGNVALARKYAEAAGWKEHKNPAATDGNPVQVAAWVFYKDKNLYSVFVSTAPETFLLDKKVHPDLVGVPFGTCTVTASEHFDIAAVEELKARLNTPGCTVEAMPGAPKSTTLVHWPMRGPGYAFSYGFARFESKDSEGTIFKRDVLGRTFVATDESQSKAFVRSACEAKHPVIAPTMF